MGQLVRTKGARLRHAILPLMRNGLIIRLCAGSCLAGGVWLAYTQQGNQPAKLDLIKVADDLYVIHNDFSPGNSTALLTSDGVILVDDKFPVDHDGILAQLKKVTDKPIRYVINTHHHRDHTGGNALLQRMNATVIASKQARENMGGGRQPGSPDITIEQRGQLHLGGQTVQLYYFGRAHTNGDIVVLLPAQHTLVAGDMFTFGPDVPELIDYGGGGSGKEWTATIDEALKLNFQTVVPGHGPVASKADMMKFRDSTITLRDRVHDMLAQNKNKAEVAEMLKQEFHFPQMHLSRSLDGLMTEMR